MIKVLSALHIAEAEIIKDLLHAEGVVAEVRGDYLTGAAGEIPVSEARPSVWVQPEEAERAAKLVESFFAEKAPTGASWTCVCGEIHEPQFTNCWNCGAERSPKASS